MEPPVRLYNTNLPGRPRRRVAPRQEARPERAPSRETVAGPDAPTSAPDMPSPAQAAEIAPPPEAQNVAGPVVGVADFEDIFTRFQTPLCNFVFRLVGNREQAYDLTQDVFVKAYRALASGTTIQAGALSSWLYRIASNTATDALRRRRLIAWLPLSLFNEDRGVGAGLPGGMDGAGGQSGTGDESFPGTASVFAGGGYDGARFEQRVADREIVERVLSRLPSKYAVCLLLYEHEGFSCAEIAEVLNVSPSAVKMRLMRARERFIALYKQETGG
jgi:RNA polymerase sigma-70 factor, ECF subfamily